jgi:hypothetical protein
MKRLAPVVCALALAVPATAAAKPAPQPPTFSHSAAAGIHAGTSDAADGWQIAAVTEGGLLAAFAFGSVALVRGRRRAVLGV